MTFGSALRQAREARGLTLRELAQTTAIRRDYLEALENRALGDLPEATFARAYLRRYARELGLDPAPLLADFDRPVQPAPPEPEAPAITGPPEDRAPPLGPTRTALIAVLVVLLAAVGTLLLRRQLPAAVAPDPPVPIVAAPDPPALPVPRAPPPAPAVSGTVRLTVKSVPDGAQVYLDNRNLGPTPVLSFPVDARAGAQLRVEAVGRMPLKQTIDLGQSRNLRATLPASNEGPSVLTDLNTGIKTLTPLPPPPPIPAAAAVSAQVSVRFVGPSWTRVTDGAGRLLYEGTPPAGSMKGFPAGVTIRAGNAGAVQVSVGGKPQRAMGEAGQVVTRRY